jgi:hypothetical protein
LWIISENPKISTITCEAIEKYHGQWKISEIPKISTKRFEAIERNHVFLWKISEKTKISGNCKKLCLVENIGKPKNFHHNM